MTDPRIEAVSDVLAQWIIPGVPAHPVAVAVIAALDKAAIISDPEDADSLPNKVLILTEQGGYWESIKRADEKNWWQEPGTSGGGYVAASEDLTYPARIIHRGTE